MEVEYLLTDEDAIAFNIYYFEGLSWGRRHPQWPWWLILAVVAISFGSFAPQIDPQSFLVMILIAAGTIGWAVYSLATWRTRIANQARRTWKQSDLPEQVRCQLHISPEGMSFRTRDTSTTFHWRRVTRIAMIADYAFFFTGERVGHILPRRAFDTSEEFEAFVKTARQYRKADRRGYDDPSRVEEPDSIEPDTRIRADKDNRSTDVPPPSGAKGES